MDIFGEKFSNLLLWCLQLQYWNSKAYHWSITKCSYFWISHKTRKLRLEFMIQSYLVYNLCFMSSCCKYLKVWYKRYLVMVVLWLDTWVTWNLRYGMVTAISGAFFHPSIRSNSPVSNSRPSQISKQGGKMSLRKHGSRIE